MDYIKPYEPYFESSLSRVWRHNIEHDCGALSAFRKYDDKENGGDGHLLTTKEKEARSRQLKARLLREGFGVTEVEGIYPESGHPTKEKSFFVVNLDDRKDFFETLVAFGEEFYQDSILFVPKGSIENNGNRAFLYGTNHSPDSFVGYGEKSSFNKGHIAMTSPIYTTYVNGRPFIFESAGREVQFPGTGYGVWAMHKVANQKLHEEGEDENKD